MTRLLPFALLALALAGCSAPDAGAPAGAFLTIGQVVAVHIDDALLADGVYHTAAAQPVLRAGGPTAYYGIDETHRFDLRRPD